MENGIIFVRYPWIIPQVDIILPWNFLQTLDFIQLFRVIDKLEYFEINYIYTMG